MILSRAAPITQPKLWLNSKRAFHRTEKSEGSAYFLNCLEMFVFKQSKSFAILHAVEIDYHMRPFADLETDGDRYERSCRRNGQKTVWQANEANAPSISRLG